MLDYHFEKRGNTNIWLGASFNHREFIDQIADCDQLLARPDCRIVKDQKKIKVARLSLAIAGRNFNVYIKRYNAFSLRYRTASLLTQSGALKSLHGAELLQDAGIGIPTPVAAIETRVAGMLTKSFFVTEEIAGGKTSDAYWREDLAWSPFCRRRQRRSKFLAGLASLFRSLHVAAVYHNDLKDANIMAVCRPDGQSPSFYLLDLEGVRRYERLSEKRRIKNLVQIHRTLGRHVRRSEKLYFLKTYLDAAATDRARRKRLIKIVLSESARLDAVKGIVRLQHHSGSLSSRERTRRAR